ncbi:MAG: copper-translocating P-type ATPase [Firmicutes bacterium]|nr:copper-translocating P-type ATPase [Bacillota bacterium]
MKKVILKIEGMTCSACSSGLEKYLNRQVGIRKATVNLVLAQALIEYEDHLTIEKLNQYIQEAGFESLGIYQLGEKEKKKKENHYQIFIVSFLAIFILYLSMSHMIGLPSVPYFDMIKNSLNYAMLSFIITVFFLIYGRDILKSGYRNLIHKTPNMDTLVSIGVIASVIYSIYGTVMICYGHHSYVKNLYFESAIIVIYFIKLGRIIDAKSREKTKEAIQGLVQITPTVALIKTESGEKEVTLDEVKKGDVLIAKPGMKIAVDGVILEGETHLDESFLTGESIPVKKTVGNQVIAGSMNQDGAILYEAVKIGKDSMISEVVRLVVEATNTKAPIAKLADKVSGYFVPTIILIAIITLFGHLLFGSNTSDAIRFFVSVLVVACPCALGLATPLAMIVSEGVCAKKGILVKSSEILETAHQVDAIVFDKTGTLTYGNLKISKVYHHPSISKEALLLKIASMESKSTHPIGTAFLNDIKEKEIPLQEVTEVQNIPGIGLKGKIEQQWIYVGNAKLIEQLQINNPYQKEEELLSQKGNSIVYFILENEVLGIVGVKDIVRSDAKLLIAKLKALGKEVIMLTGDHEKTAEMIATSIGIEHIISQVLPTDKQKEIEKLMNEGKKVMMVGDGINDAPALASATVGVSVNSGTDIAMNSAGVIFMQDHLLQIVDLLHISKRTIQIVKENLFWAFFYNICMIPIAIGILRPWGISMNPMFAGFAMTISSFTVVLNSLRLRNIKMEEKDDRKEKDKN